MMITINERISDDVRWCISNVEQRLQSHKFFISSLKAKKIVFNLNWGDDSDWLIKRIPLMI